MGAKYSPLMTTTIESITQELRDLPSARLIEVSAFIHKLHPAVLSAERRRTALRATAGCMAGSEGAEFEQAVRSTSDRIDSHE